MVLSSSGDAEAALQDKSSRLPKAGGTASASRGCKRKRNSPAEEEQAKWRKLEEIYGGLDPFPRQPTFFYQVRVEALLSPSDALGVDIWPHNTNTIKLDLRFAALDDRLPPDSPTPAGYSFRIFEALGDEFLDPNTVPELDSRHNIFSVQVDVLPSEGLPRWRPASPTHFATLALPSGQYIWSQVYKNYGAQYGRNLWGSVEFSTSRGFGTKVTFVAEFPLWFSSNVRPEIFDADPSPSLRSRAFTDMMLPGKFLAHSLATTSFVDVVDSLFKARACAAGSKSIGDSGVTALHLAAWKGPPEMVRFLAQLFPEALFEKDDCGNTPYDIAVFYTRSAASDLLDILLAQLNPHSGDYIWGKYVMEHFVPKLGETSITSKPIGHVISLFCRRWWPRHSRAIYRWIRPSAQPLPSFANPVPNPAHLIPPPSVKSARELWYRPRPAPEPVDITEWLKPVNGLSQINNNKLVPLGDAFFDRDMDNSPEPFDDDNQVDFIPERIAAVADGQLKKTTYDPSAPSMQLEEEDLQRGYWLELADNDGIEPATLAANDLNGRCGKVRQDRLRSDFRLF